MSALPTEAVERGALEDAGYDTTRVVARGGHHCLYAQRGEKCNAATCSTEADERDGFVCTACGATGRRGVRGGVPRGEVGVMELDFVSANEAQRLLDALRRARETGR